MSVSIFKKNVMTPGGISRLYNCFRYPKLFLKTCYMYVYRVRYICLTLLEFPITLYTLRLFCFCFLAKLTVDLDLLTSEISIDQQVGIVAM